MSRNWTEKTVRIGLLFFGTPAKLNVSFVWIQKPKWKIMENASTRKITWKPSIYIISVLSVILNRASCWLCNVRYWSTFHCMNKNISLFCVKPCMFYWLIFWLFAFIVLLFLILLNELYFYHTLCFVSLKLIFFVFIILQFITTPFYTNTLQ